jgi:stress-induced morphogen
VFSFLTNSHFSGIICILHSRHPQFIYHAQEFLQRMTPTPTLKHHLTPSQHQPNPPPLKQAQLTAYSLPTNNIPSVIQLSPIPPLTTPSNPSNPLTYKTGGCGQSFTTLIVSPQFAGQNSLKRHRAVNAALRDEIAVIHAWSAKCQTPEEWEKSTAGTGTTAAPPLDGTVGGKVDGVSA